MNIDRNLLERLVKCAGHEYTCPVRSFLDHARTAGVGCFHRRQHETVAAARARVKREYEEYHAGRPACICALGEAEQLLKETP